MCFWCFDYIHPWHEYFLKQAKKLADKLIVVVARDKNIKNIKGKFPYYNENQRLQNLKKLWYVDVVVKWYIYDKYKIITRFKPNCICLGYDQNSYNTDKLHEFIKNNWFSIEIITLNSYYPTIYKSSIIKDKLGLV